MIENNLPDVVTNHQPPPQSPPELPSPVESTKPHITFIEEGVEADEPSDNGSEMTNNNNKPPTKLASSSSKEAIMPNNSAVQRDRFIKRQYDHVVRMLITVTVVFSICQIPDMLIQLIARLYGGWDLSEELSIIAYDFVIINSSINLFIYTVTSQRFKKHLFKTFKCFNRNKDQVSNIGQTTLDLS